MLDDDRFYIVEYCLGFLVLKLLFGGCQSTSGFESLHIFLDCTPHRIPDCLLNSKLHIKPTFASVVDNSFTCSCDTDLRIRAEDANVTTGEPRCVESCTPRVSKMGRIPIIP